ncbi:MAG TPA: transposase, partial [Verrucomicrobiae bacterium]
MFYLMNMATALQDLWRHLQRELFPMLLEELGEMGEKDRQFVSVVALLPIGRFVHRYDWMGWGRPPHERAWIIHAFVAKSVYGFIFNESLIDALKARPVLRRLCGWDSASDIPSAATFSRAFAQFSADELPQRIHEAMIKQHCGPKLVGHISRDATAIQAPERPAPKAAETAETAQPAPRRKPGRPKKGEVRPPKPPTKLEQQVGRTLAHNLADLPRQCDVGCKTDSKGYKTWWRGYKLHLDVIDGDIPVSAVLTSASLHDSQAAIPLAQMTTQRVKACYELMDSAYDAECIRTFVEGLGHVPIIEPKQREGFIPLDPAERQRFGQRSASERVNSRLKESFG